MGHYRSRRRSFRRRHSRGPSNTAISCKGRVRPLARADLVSFIALFCGCSCILGAFLTAARLGCRIVHDGRPHDDVPHVFSAPLNRRAVVTPARTATETATRGFNASQYQRSCPILRASSESRSGYGPSATPSERKAATPRRTTSACCLRGSLGRWRCAMSEGTFNTPGSAWMATYRGPQNTEISCEGRATWLSADLVCCISLLYVVSRSSNAYMRETTLGR
jgi:hypothetical protein